MLFRSIWEGYATVIVKNPVWSSKDCSAFGKEDAMAAVLHPDTVEWLRGLPPRKAYKEAREAVYRSGPVSSEDFLDVYEQLVEEDILTWDQINAFDR